MKHQLWVRDPPSKWQTEIWIIYGSWAIRSCCSTKSYRSLKNFGKKFIHERPAENRKARGITKQARQTDEIVSKEWESNYGKKNVLVGSRNRDLRQQTKTFFKQRSAKNFSQFAPACKLGENWRNARAGAWPNYTIRGSWIARSNRNVSYAGRRGETWQRRNADVFPMFGVNWV